MGSLWDDAEANAKAQGSTPDDSDIDVNLDELDDDKLDTGDDTETEEVEETEEKEETTEKVVKPTKEAADDTGFTATQQKQVQDQVIKLVGPDAILKVKGVERKVSELTPQELTVYLQKGMNADRLFQEHATARKSLERERAAVEQGAAALQEYLQQQQAGRPGARPGVGDTGGYITELPDYLKPTAEDTPEVQRWKESQVKMLDDFNAMKRYIASTAQREVDQKKVDEVLALRETYPMASVDEVLVLKTARPREDTEELMRISHNYYSGGEFIKKAIAANPTFQREYHAEVIKNYLAKKTGAPKIPGKKVRGGAVDKVSFGTERKNFRRTFEDADSLSREFIKEQERMAREG